MKKRCLTALFSVCLTLCLTLTGVQPVQATTVDTPAASWPSGPSVNAQAALVMELSTGTILYEKNATDAMYPASITKVMTGLLAVENSSMDEIVHFSNTAVYGNGSNSSSIGMKPGESITMEHCMYGMMLASANEVAKAIGEHIAGDLESFVTMMNDRAAELGCVNTHFANPNGLHDDNHYTCAYDMALIAREAIKDPTFKKVSGTRVFVIPPTAMTEDDRWVANTHQMVNPAQLPQYRYNDCYAGKTGFTSEARYTLVTYAKRGALDIVCVTMHSQMQADQYNDAITLMDYVFDNFSVHPISQLGQTPSFDNFSLFTRFSPLFDMENAPLSIDTDSYVILPNGASYSGVEQTITYHDLDALEKGLNAIGEITYTYGNKTVGATDILYDSTEDLVLTPPEETPEGTDSAPIEEETPNNDKPAKPEKNKEKKEKDGPRWGRIILITVIALILLGGGGAYLLLVELPYRRRRRAYYSRRRKRTGSRGNYIR